MLAYMVKNKDWCQIPDDAIASFKASHAKSVAFGGKACTVAAQIEKMKKQAAQAQQQQQARRRAAGPAVARRPALKPDARRPAGRAARSLALRLAPPFALPYRPTRAPRPSDRLAAAARALLVGDGAGGRRGASRPEPRGICLCS